MKKLWITFLFLLCCMPGLALAEYPQAFQCGAYTYTLDQAGNATITSWWHWLGEEMGRVVEVPAELDGHPVRTLGNGAFATGFADIEESFCLVIPEGVTDIEGDPFMCCHDAWEIVLPSTLLADLEDCFYHVSADITVAKDNPAYIVRDGYLIDTRTDTLLYAGRTARNRPLPALRRYGRRCLENWQTDADAIVIPEGVEVIGSYAFNGAAWDKRLMLPESVTNLESFAFFGSCLRAVNFPANLTAIPEGCLIECLVGNGVELPASITFVGYKAFEDETLVTALNPACHFETQEEYEQRAGEDAFYW